MGTEDGFAVLVRRPGVSEPWPLDKSRCRIRQRSARDARMPRTKKSIKSRSKVKRQALKRKRIRRKKSLRRGMRAR